MTKADVTYFLLLTAKAEWSSLCDEGLVLPSWENDLVKDLSTLRRPGVKVLVGEVRPGMLRELLTDLLNFTFEDDDMVDVLLLSGEGLNSSECKESIHLGLVLKSYGGKVNHIRLKDLCEGLPAKFLKDTVMRYTV